MVHSKKKLLIFSILPVSFSYIEVPGANFFHKIYFTSILKFQIQCEEEYDYICESFPACAHKCDKVVECIDGSDELSCLSNYNLILFSSTSFTAKYYFIISTPGDKGFCIVNFQSNY